MSADPRAKPAPAYPPRHMRGEEAARYVGVSLATLERTRRAGLIGSYRDGGMRFYDRDELDRYCEARTYEPPTRGEGLTVFRPRRTG